MPEEEVAAPAPMETEPEAATASAAAGAASAEEPAAAGEAKAEAKAEEAAGADKAAAETEAKADAKDEGRADVEVPRKHLEWLAGKLQEIERLSGARVEIPRATGEQEGAAEGAAVQVIVRGSPLHCARARVLLEDQVRSAPEKKEGAGEDAPAEAPTRKPRGRVIAGRSFADRDDLDAHIKKLQNHCKDGVLLAPEDSFFMFHLSTFHQHFLEKMNAPVVGFKYGEHEMFKGSKCFFIVRADGTEEGLSAKKCAEGVFPGTNMKRGQKRDREQKEEAEKGAAAGSEEAAREGGDEEKEQEPPQKRQREINEGCIVIIEGVPSDLEYHDLREMLGDYGDVRFVEFIRPEKKAAASAEDEGKEEETKEEAKGEAKEEAKEEAKSEEAKEEKTEEAKEKKTEEAKEEKKEEAKEEKKEEAKEEKKEEAKEEKKEEAKEETKDEPKAESNEASEKPADEAKDAKMEGGEGDKAAAAEGEEKPKVLCARARFRDAEGAAKCVAEFKDIDGTAVSCHVLAGEEERLFWERLWAAADAKGGKGKGKKGKGKGKDKGKDKGKGKGKGKGKDKGKKGKK